MSKSRILLAGTALFVTLICWSLSSPINSHQDEKFHLASIWCADGFDENCEFKGLSEFGVKTVLLKMNLCTPADTDETEYTRLLVNRSRTECKFESTESEPLNKMSTSINFFYETNSVVAAWIQPGNNPNFYYKFSKLFQTSDAGQSVITIRIINSLLFLLPLIVFLLIGEQKIQTSALFGLILTIIPHGLFLISSISNSSWAYAGCSLSWAFLYAMLNQPLQFNWRTGLAILGWVATSGLVLFGRYDATVYLIFTNFVILLMKVHAITKLQKRHFIVVLTLVLIPAIIILTRLPYTQFLGRGPFSQSNSALDLLIIFGNAVKLFIATPLRIFGLQAPGMGPMQASISVFLINTFFVFLVSFVMLRTGQKAQKIKLLPLTCFLFGIYLVMCYSRRDWTTPFYFIRTSWAGDTFSPRYFVPYFPFLFGMLALSSRNFPKIFLDIKFKVASLTVLSLTQAITLHDIGSTFRVNPSWYWQKLPIGIDVVLFVGIISFISFLYFVIFPSSSREIVNSD